MVDKVDNFIYFCFMGQLSAHGEFPLGFLFVFYATCGGGDFSHSLGGIDLLDGVFGFSGSGNII